MAVTRIDYLDDPAAPRATVIVPGVSVAVADDDGRPLVIQRSDNGNWALPGGGVELGESLEDAAVREVEEETGVRCRLVGLVGIYTHPGHVIAYEGSEEVRQEFAVVLSGRWVSGEARPGAEAADVAWVSPHILAEEFPMHPSMRLRVEHYVGGPEVWPHIG